MTVDAATSPTWTCSACQVTARYAPGRPTPALPDGWERHADGLRCLRCARARAVAIALREAELDDDARGEQTIEREALAAFEIRRDDTRSNTTIGKAAGIPLQTVAAVRRKLEAEHPSGRNGAGGGS